MRPQRAAFHCNTGAQDKRKKDLSRDSARLSQPPDRPRIPVKQTYPKALSRAARENYSVNAISLTTAPGSRMLPTLRER